MDVVIQDNLDDCDNWLLGEIEHYKPSIVVAIARGAVLFLQLRSKILRLEKVRFLSHHALPFLTDSEIRNARILLVDDSIVFGSTVSEVWDYLERRGAVVFCATYAVDRVNFLGESRNPAARPGYKSPHTRVPVVWKHKLWPTQIRQHHSTLVRLLLCSPLHYNLDFPTFCVRLRLGGTDGASLTATHLKRMKTISKLTNVSWPESEQSGMPHFTSSLKQIPGVRAVNEGLFLRPYSKVRFILVPAEDEIRFTPLLQFGVNANTRFSDISFDYTGIQDLWSKMRVPGDEPDSAYAEGLFRLVTAFASTIAGALVLRDISEVLAREHPVLSAELLTSDMQFLFGEHNAGILRALFESLPPDYRGVPGESRIGVLPEPPNNPVLCKKIVAVMRRDERLTPTAEEHPWESVGKVFLGLRGATDSQELRKSDPSSGRMKVGLSHSGINTILTDEFAVKITPEEIGLAIDMFVDRGLAVPRISGENGVLSRTMYCGEDEDDQPTLQLKSALHKSYSSFANPRKGRLLSLFDLQKICTVLKGLIPELPITAGPCRYGYVSSGEVAGRKSVAWMVQGKYAPFTEVIDAKTKKRRVLVPNTQFQSPVARSWSERTVRDFDDAFDFLASAFLKLHSDEKVMLSSCRTHRHAFNAVAFELHAWCGYHEGTFGDFLTRLERSTAWETGYRDREDVGMYMPVRYTAEAHKKIRIFYKEYGKLLKRIDQHVCRKNDAAGRWWRYAKQVLGFDPTPDPEIEHKMSVLLPLLRQMARLTSFVVAALQEGNWYSRAYVAALLEPHGQSLTHRDFDWLNEWHWKKAAREYNQAISKRTLAGRSLFKTLLPEQGPSGEREVDNWLKKSVKVARACFDELSSAIHEYIPKYDDTEFPFSPDLRNRPLADGRIERRRENVFMLTLDIIKGTNSEQTNEMKEEVRNTFRRFEEKGLVFEDTGNDAFIAIAEDSLVLWDVAKSLALKGEALKAKGGRFGGTRKGLYFGSVAVIEKQNGDRVIRDIRIPNDVPRAFYVLDGVDKCIEEGRRNQFLAIEKSTLAGCAARLAIDAAKHAEHPVEAKHFSGSCYLIDLS